MPALAELLDPGYPGPLAERSLEDLRSMRADCQDVETGLSLLRRMVQGHLDIVGAEVRSRAEGRPSGGLAELIDRLPELLSDRTHTPGVGRLPQLLAPAAVDPEMEAELAAVLARSSAGLGSLDDDELAAVAADLTTLENRVSAHRRSLFDRIDALQEEIARRYREGEASVDALL